MKTESSWRYEPMFEAKAGDFTVPFTPKYCSLMRPAASLLSFIAQDLSRVAAAWGVCGLMQSVATLLNERKFDPRLTQLKLMTLLQPTSMSWIQCPYHHMSSTMLSVSTVTLERQTGWDATYLQLLLDVKWREVILLGDLLQKQQGMLFSLFFFGNSLHDQELNNHDWTRLH